MALKGVNEDELDRMVAWCGAEGFDLTLIETMPLGDIDGDRTEQYLPLSLVRARLARSWTLTDIPDRTGGPARYVRVEETGGRLGFITPLTHNFCESCNRVRVTCTGTMYMCLGQEDAADLRAPLRASEGDEPLKQAILRRDRAQAQGPRLRHRPAAQQAGGRAAHERHRGLSSSNGAADGAGRPSASQSAEDDLDPSVARLPLAIGRRDARPALAEPFDLERLLRHAALHERPERRSWRGAPTAGRCKPPSRTGRHGRRP